MPPKRTRAKTTGSPVPESSSRAARCTAKTSSGEPCKRVAVKGLKVCKSHGGGTAASVRKSQLANAASQAELWGISTDASSLSVVDELNKLARNKLTDIIAIRVELSRTGASKHYGMLRSSVEETENEVGEDIYRTIKTKKSAGTSPLVQELHKAETELVAILRLIHEVTGGNDSEQDMTRVRLQVAREAARLMKGFPGMSVEDVAAEVGKR